MSSESEYREALIAMIEGVTGTLQSVPFSQISTQDLVVLHMAITK
jgi:hypothetical protein